MNDSPTESGQFQTEKTSDYSDLNLKPNAVHQEHSTSYADEHGGLPPQDDHKVGTSLAGHNPANSARDDFSPIHGLHGYGIPLDR